ncbi:MAG TPA: hypothetical protein VK002_08860 [Rubricoccaceae bacterium]|nr:hypothetical protein [Rubricoccaceae bacterium]
MPEPLWTLPWHYLATPICLLYYSHIKPDLMEKFESGVLDPSEVLAPNQPRRPNGNPPLFDEVKIIGQQTQDARFPWGTAWDPNLELRIREWTSAQHDGNFILTRGTLYLRSPSIPGAPTPIQLETGVPAAGADFYSEAFMAVIDELVTTEAGRKFFSSDSTGVPHPNDVDAEGKIRGVLYGQQSTQGVPYDPALTVHVEADWHTYQTTWERYDDHFHLRLGWIWDDQDKAMIADWPCGALS